MTHATRQPTSERVTPNPRATVRTATHIMSLQTTDALSKIRAMSWKTMAHWPPLALTMNPTALVLRNPEAHPAVLAMPKMIPAKEAERREERRHVGSEDVCLYS